MKSKIKFFILGFIFCLMLGGLVYGMAQVSDVYLSTFGIKLNGQKYNPEMPVLNYQGRTYLALRELGTVTGNEIDFIDNTIIINNKGYSKPNTNNTGNVTLGQKNALDKAKSYLKFMAFSYEGLKEQLEYEGFSSSEAKYGVDNCGANWYEQAAKKAKSYMEIMSFSRSRLIEQLEYEGFTYDQAVYGAKAVGY